MLVMFVSVAISMEAPTLPVDMIGKDEHLLRHIAMSIFDREQQIQIIKKKMCTHGQEMFDAWRLNKSWGELDNPIKESLQKTIKKNEIQSILRRPRYALLSPDVIAHPEQFRIMIEKGQIVLDQSPDTKLYGIRVSFDFTPQVFGRIFDKDKESGKIEERPSTRLFITFEINDIVKKITTIGKNSWNPAEDGRMTTLCVE